MAHPELRHILEGALLAAGEALSVDQLRGLFADDARPDAAEIRKALAWLARDYDGRGIEVREVASGYRIQVREALPPWVSRLWEERPARYSRALLETLAIIAYRQPITRGEIEDIRGVTVSTSIVRTLQERNWIRTVGHRDVPGRPALLATSRAFLDYFNLKGLDELPSLMQLREFDGEHPELDLRLPATDAADSGEPSREIDA